MTSITVFLTSDRYPRIYREVVSEADAIQRIRTSKLVTFDLDEDSDTLAVLDVIFAVTNDVFATEEQREAADEYRRDAQTRSLSVGDVVHVPGLGLFSVQPMGWKRHDHRLTALAAAHRALAETRPA